LVAGDAVFGSWGVDVFGWLDGEHWWGVSLVGFCWYFVPLFVAFCWGLVNMLYCGVDLFVGGGYFCKIFW